MIRFDCVQESNVNFANSDNANVLYHCRFLCFADDVKLFMRMFSIENCLKLQTDINIFSVWSNKMGLSLNLSQCKVFTYHRIKLLIDFNYRINNEINISRELNSIMDLGLKFGYNLDPKLHIDFVCFKAFKSLGFIM